MYQVKKMHIFLTWLFFYLDFLQKRAIFEQKGVNTREVFLMPSFYNKSIKQVSNMKFCTMSCKNTEKL